MMKKQETENTPVIIIGGSLVGLSAAMFLAWQKVPVILIEKHTASSKHPRAMGYPSRTMEIYRAVGIEDQIPQASAHFSLRRATVESLAGKWISETAWTPEQKRKQEAPKVEYSPCIGAAIAQDKLEPILRNKALELGADLRLGTELLHFDQDEKEVTAYVRERESGREYTIKAEYMIATDGNTSPIREALNIGRKGIGNLQVMRSVLFKAPLDEYLASGVSQFEIEQPDLKAFLTTYRDSRWVLMFKDDIERNETQLIEDIKKAIGKDDIPIEIITTGRWDLSALITDEFKKGRIFLAGDAAHTLPPTRGGFGANTGIQDVHNLAWKLKSVISGTANPKLLDTYHKERQPISWVRYQQMFARPDYAVYAKEEELKNLTLYDDVSMELGQIYRSEAIIANNENLPDAMLPNQWNGQPGTRAPHIWMMKDNKKISSLDLFQNGWVLLTANEAWNEASLKVNDILKVELKGIKIGSDIKVQDTNAFRTLFGIGDSGATLIRPDGYIAWRSAEEVVNHEQLLLEIVKQASFAI
jgi:putative polyketide hydroxylase